MTAVGPTALCCIGDALEWGRTTIGPAEARMLLAHVLECSRTSLIAFPERALSADAAAVFQQMVLRRADGEPVAYLLGQREFYGRMFYVGPGVLIPRPETELLIELTRVFLAGRPAPSLLDLGTGSGAIALTLALELPAAQIVAVERSDAALAIAQRNAQSLGAAVRFQQGSWFSAVVDEAFDLIVANPPYVARQDPHLQQGDVRFEPLEALASGEDGLDDIRHIITAAPDHLKPEAVLLMEHGFDQAAKVRKLLGDAGYTGVASACDLAGIERATYGRVPSGNLTTPGGQADG